MMRKDDSFNWLQKRTEEYRFEKSDMRETIEYFDDMEKLGHDSYRQTHLKMVRRSTSFPT
jgi:hypothetical protein